MDIDEIRYFLTVAEDLNFWESAEKNHISQSSFSKAIMRLERELGVKLFDRTHRPVKLTAAGKCFYRDMLALVPGFQDAIRNVTAFADVVTLNVLTCPKSYAFQDGINAFLKEHPKVQINVVRISQFTEVVQKMVNEKFDFCISIKPLVIPPYLRCSILYDDGLFLLAPKNSEFSGRASISLKELDGKVMIESTFSRYLLQELVRYFGFKPSEIYPKEDLPGIRREEVIYRTAVGQGYSLLLGRDITMFNDQRVIRIPVMEFPSLPTVLMETVGVQDSIIRQEFRTWMEENLQRFVYPSPIDK